jgi:hypothetical protein
MEIRLDKFAGALGEAVTQDERRLDVWPVYPSYEVHRNESGEPFVYAPVDIGEFVDERRMYRPLADTPALFLEFARGGAGEQTEATWLDWIHCYGVLGLSSRRTQFMRYAGSRGGQGESLQSFGRYVKEAHLALRLYELATAPYGPDAATIATLIHSSRYGSSVHDQALQDTDSAANHAMVLARVIVQEVLSDHACPVLYPTDSTERRHAVAWGFQSLLGAMFLQMMWLMTATGEERRCEGPGCSAVIAFDAPKPMTASTKKNDRSMGYRTRRDKRFCSPACKQASYRKNHPR